MIRIAVSGEEGDEASRICGQDYLARGLDHRKSSDQRNPHVLCVANVFRCFLSPLRKRGLDSRDRYYDRAGMLVFRAHQPPVREWSVPDAEPHGGMIRFARKDSQKGAAPFNH